MVWCVFAVNIEIIIMERTEPLMLLLSQIINGLQLGSIYALVALGYSMVYGIIMLQIGRAHV